MKVLCLSCSSEHHLPTIVWSPDHKSIDVHVHGKRISLAAIPKAYRQVKKTANRLFRLLTRGIETALEIPYHEIVDNLTDTTPNYSFLHFPPLETYRFRSILMLMKKPEYVVKYEGTDVIWRKPKIEAWMKKAQELNECPLFLLHLGSGQPARGTEIPHILIHNMPNVHRSLFAIPWVLLPSLDTMRYVISYSSLLFANHSNFVLDSLSDWERSLSPGSLMVNSAIFC